MAYPHGVSVRRPTRLRRALLLLAAVSLALGACSGFAAKVSRRFGGKVPFNVEIDSRLNQDFPLAVDLVVVYDKALYKELGQLTAEDWFKQREQYRTDNQPEKLEIHSWQWVPPEPCPPCEGPEPQLIEHRLGARGGVIFTDYFNAGIHRAVVEPLEGFTLKLGETDASVVIGENTKAAKKAAKKREKEQKRKRKSEKKEQKKQRKKAS